MNPKGKNWQVNSNLCPTDLDVAVKVFLKTVLKLLEQIFFSLVSAASTAAEFASCLASCVHSAASCFDFSSWTMQTAVLHAQLVICSVSSHFVMSICSQPEETSINSQKKRKTLSNCRNLQRRKPFFMHHFLGHISLPGDDKLLLSAFHPSLSNQPRGYDDGGGWGWITGAELMRQRKITAASKQDSSKLMAI